MKINKNIKKKNQKNKDNFKKKIEKLPNSKMQSTNDSNSKIIKLKSDFSSKNLIHITKLKITILVIILIFVLLLGRIGYLQFIDGNHLKELAYSQQTINQIISPKRGNIYDSTGKALAISASVDTITINPSKITDNNEGKAKALKEKVAKGLSDIFELDYNETLEKVNSNSQVQTIAKKVEQDKVDQLKTWMQENDITIGINIDEDSKRYYPYSTVLSNVLGFCGTDNNGISGIESSWDNILTGTPR